MDPKTLEMGFAEFKASLQGNYDTRLQDNNLSGMNRRQRRAWLSQQRKAKKKK